MILVFTLTMPGVGSWNGKWSGAGDFYAKVRNMGRGKKNEAKGLEIIENAPYIYRWEDGWVAKIRVEQVDAKEARQIRNKTKGFCGYDWMVTTILEHGKIATKKELGYDHT